MTTQQDAAQAIIHPSDTLRTSASIYYSLLGLGLLVFELVRRRFPHAYDSRGVGTNVFWTETAASLSEKPFDWIFSVYRVSDEEIMERCGLDTLSFLRFLRMGQKVALVVIALSVVLLPLYATATPPPANRSNIDPLERINMSNLGEHDLRLWASTIAAFIVCFFAMYLILKEYQYYVARRHELLGKAEAPQYTILIDELPVKLRTRMTLEAYMKRLFPDTLRSVYVAVECSKLEHYVADREKVRNKLEHALGMCEKKHGERPQHREGGSWLGCLLCRHGGRGEYTDSIDFYQEQLAKFNEKVAREITSIEGTQALLVRRMETEEAGEEVPYVPQDPGQPDISIRIGNQQQSPHGDNKTERSGPLSDEEDDDDDDDISESGREEDENEREAARRKRPIRVMRRSAFVSFTSLKSAQVAQQTLQSSNPIHMAISAAPHADDIDWENIGLRFRTRALWRLISSTLTAIIVLFWTIPTAFVASLATVESLRRALPFLNKAIDKYPILDGVFKQLAPLALVLLNALAPAVFSFLSAREGHPSNTEVRASLFTKLAFFQLIQIFFVTVIVGTVLDSLKEIIDQPKRLISMLGRSMPQQSTFFISYVIIQTGLNLVLELLRIVPIAISVIFHLVAPKLTKREREGTWLGLRSISNTETFDPTSEFTDAFLVMLVTLTFAPIAPLTCYFTGLYFFVADVVYRRQVLFVYKPMFFALGAYWPRMYKFLIVALVVAQLTLIGLLSLKNAPAQIVLVVGLITVVLLFNHYMMLLFPRVAKHLSVTECARLDALRAQRDRRATFSFLDNVYHQPAMSEKVPLQPDYRLIGDESENGAMLSPPDNLSGEDQRLFRSRAI